MTIHSKQEYEKRQNRVVEAQAQQTALHNRVGVYMVCWASTESLLIGMIGHLLGITKSQAQIIYTGLHSVHARRATITALIKHSVAEPLRGRLLTALNVFKTETSRRNLLAHGEFQTNERGFYTKLHYYDLEQAESENVAVKTIDLTQSWFDGIGDGLRRLSWLDDEFGKIIENWLADKVSSQRAETS